MNIRYYKYLLAVCVIQLLFFGAQAQGLSLTQERLFRLNALRLIEDYQDNAPLSNYEMMATFSSLFVDSSLPIYNDLLGVSSSKELPVSEYVSLLKSKATYPKIDIKNVQFGELRDDNDNWLLDVTFDKEIVYTDACEVLLSSKEYYGQDHKMKAVIAMDKTTGQCRILSLNGSNDSNRPILGKDYAVVLNSDSRDKEVLCNGKKIEFNSFNQAIVPSNPVFTYRDPDVNLKVNRQSGTCEVYSLSYKPVRWRAKVYGGMSLGDFYKLSDTDNKLNVSSSELSMGLDLGYILPMKGKVKLGIFVGAGYSMAKMKYGLDALNYHYRASASADYDRDTYTRYYEIKNINQTLKFNSLIIPVYLDLDFHVAKRFSIYAQAGAKGYMKMSESIGEITGEIYTYGIYPQYGNLRLNEQWDNRQFGNKSISDQNLSESDNLNVKSFSFDVFGGLGVRVQLFGPLVLDLGASYQMGITDFISNSGDLVKVNGGEVSENTALISYTTDGGEKLRSLSGTISSVKRQCLKLHFGLMFKF